MGQITTQKPDDPKRRRRLVLRLTVAAVILIPLGGFLAFTVWIDSGELSPELLAPPEEIVARLKIPQSRVRADESAELPPIESGMIERSADAEQSAAPATEPQEPPKSFASYEDFLPNRLEARPEVKAVLGHVELAERNVEGFDQRLSLLIRGRNRPPVWQPGDGPIATEWAAWLKSNRELVDLALEFSRAGTPPEPYRSASFPDFFRFEAYVWILAAEGRARLENQDYEGAKTYYLALFRLARFFVGHANYYSNGTALILARMGLAQIEEWLRMPGFVPAEKREIAEEMARAHRVLFAGDVDLQSHVRAYLHAREGLTSRYERPWWQLGLSFAEPLRRERSKFYWDVEILGVWVDLPKPIPWAPRLLGGMRRATRFKRGFARDLESFDRQWAKNMEAYRVDFASMKSLNRAPRAPFADSLYPGESHTRFQPNLTEIHAWWLEEEARFNLVRAALALSADPELIDGRRAARTDLRRTDPMRDPFSGLGLRINDSPSSETLIYSLGPDLVDQHGLQSYFSYNSPHGTIGPGDIVLSLPKYILARQKSGQPDRQAPSVKQREDPISPHGGR